MNTQAANPPAGWTPGAARKTARDMVAKMVVESLVEEGGLAAGATPSERLSRYTDVRTDAWEITIERSHRWDVIEVSIINVLPAHRSHDRDIVLVEFECLGVSANTILAMIAAVVA